LYVIDAIAFWAIQKRDRLVLVPGNGSGRCLTRCKPPYWRNWHANQPPAAFFGITPFGWLSSVIVHAAQAASSVTTPANAREPDLVMACAGDVPTLETIAAVCLLRQHPPALKIRVVNVVDLMTLQPNDVHPHGITDREFDGLFTRERPVIFAYHGYPYLIHCLTYRRRNHDNMHVHGFKEEGTTTTPFDMTVLSQLDRFHLAMSVIEHVPGLSSRTARVQQHFRDKLIEHNEYIRRHGEDMPEIRNWSWALGNTAQAHERK
jgi:xylulose-5-phosphate/fructose-6-phosphate phosphoketolase